MTKAELIAKVAEATGSTKTDAEKAVNATVEAITEAIVAGDKVQLLGFGTFEARNRAAREGVNPATGEKLHIAAMRMPAFKPADKLKKACNA